MKQLAFILLISAIYLSGRSQAGNAPYHSVSPYFSIRFENKCPYDVQLRIEAFGAASVINMYKNSYRSESVLPGYKVYVDGKFLLEISDEHKGKSLTICSC